METWSQTSLQFTNLGRSQASATGTGLTTITTSSTSSNHLSTVSLAFNPDLSLNTAIPVTDPDAFPITSVILTSIRGRPDLTGAGGNGSLIGNISGAIASTGGGLSNAGILSPGTIPATGGAVICIAGGMCGQDNQLSLIVGATSAGVQIGGGVGGILTIGGTGAIRISVIGAPYTVKTVTAVNRTVNGGIQTFRENGFAHGPVSSTSSTAQASGVLQIVTSSNTTTVAPGPNNDLSGNISRLLVHFIPEPGLLLLFGSGAIGMVLLGRKRIRK